MFYTSNSKFYILQCGCEKQALGKDVKVRKVLKLPAVLSVAAQEEIGVLWWKAHVVKL